MPTPDKVDLGEIHNDVFSFCRRLHLKLHFYQEDSSIDTSQTQKLPKALYKFKPKNSWVPNTGDPVLRAFCFNVKKDLQELNPKQPDRFNLGKKGIRAISDLKKNPNIVIKKADKGSSVVVMNKSDYIREAERQLSDRNYYIPTEKDLTSEYHDYIQKLLFTYKQSEKVSSEIYKCLESKTVRTASLYLLPKIHKVKKAGEFPLGRPIISANGCPTEKISAFVDENIKEAVPHIKSYIKDTTDFIHKVEGLVTSSNTLLVTFDVTSLYTNIPNGDGIRATAKSLQKHPPTYAEPHIVVNLLKIVLEKNTFCFNGKNYLQIGGTAMGTKLAPSYANIFMGDLEEKLLDSYNLKPTIWYRFIDDIFCIWSHGRDELESFHKHLNSFHQTIKFTMECSQKEIIFLDTLVKNSEIDSKLSVELYRKPTDTHNYLHFSSYHPGHTKRGGPFGQFLRVRRNCTKLNDYDTHSQIMQKHYVERGYPKEHVQLARKNARHCDRGKLINPNRQPKNDQSNIVPLVLTHHPSNKQVHDIIMKHWGLLRYSERCREALPQKPLFTTRRGRNLKDILIHSRLDDNTNPSLTQKNPKSKCKKQDCEICKLVKSESATSSTTKIVHRVTKKCNCVTQNVIYLLTCSVCSKQYVGETKRAFLVRFKEHSKDIEYKRDKPLANHLSSHNAVGAKIIPNILEVVYKDPSLDSTTSYRRQREAHWIYAMRSLMPDGINTLS